MYATVQRLEAALSEAVFALNAEGQELSRYRNLHKQDPNYDTALGAAIDAAKEILSYDPQRLPRTRDAVLTAEEVRQAALQILGFQGQNSHFVDTSARKPLRTLRRALLILERSNLLAFQAHRSLDDAPSQCRSCARHSHRNLVIVSFRYLWKMCREPIR